MKPPSSLSSEAAWSNFIYGVGDGDCFYFDNRFYDFENFSGSSQARMSNNEIFGRKIGKKWLNQFFLIFNHGDPLKPHGQIEPDLSIVSMELSNKRNQL